MSPRYRSAKSCTLANFSKTYGMSAAHIMLEAEIIYREGTASESEIMKLSFQTLGNYEFQIYEKMRLFRNKSAKSCTFANLMKT